MKKLALILVVVFLGCGDGSGVGNKITETSNSNSGNIITSEGSGRVCLRCESVAGLESLGYDVESYINCTAACGLPAKGDPVKIQCDIDCINERIAIAAEFCKEDNGCDVKKKF
jgi:hypothetical protein